MVKGPIRVTDLILFHAGFGQSFPTYAHRLAYETRKKTPGLYTRNKLDGSGHIEMIAVTSEPSPSWNSTVASARNTR